MVAGAEEEEAHGLSGLSLKWLPFEFDVVGFDQPSCS
jgi:hypothetical protein